MCLVCVFPDSVGNYKADISVSILPCHLSTRLCLHTQLFNADTLKRHVESQSKEEAHKIWQVHLFFQTVRLQTVFYVRFYRLYVPQLDLCPE